ncbi:MAG: DoxX family protein, partial [Bacteroidetes bacterium]|nr:DoxX family protein [Bacteroidota bacterium]
MKTLVFVSRLIVALTFIFSGFVKLVDPLGSAYKFQEYFGADVLNMEFLIPYALPFSILLILAEIMLGVTLLLGYLPKFTVWSLLGIILVFLFLTWYSAYYDKVTDCGCFGDAVKLSSWGTFYKNIVLVVLILFLVWKVDDIKPLFGVNSIKWTT